MAEVIVVDRHVLASPATAYDTAWSTYGVTPGARSRAGRLEEEVPWGTHVTRAADPARLSGPAETVLEPANLDRLGQALLPLEGWLGYSLWGAFGPGSGERDRRVLTHTLLLTEHAFRRLRGHPAGLLGTAGRPAAWVRELAESGRFGEPVELAPLRVTVDGGAAARLDEARLAELARLRRAVLAGMGGDPVRLQLTLAGIYEALARTGPGGSHRQVVVRGVGAETSTLLRLVWLSLPLEDRLTVSYVTEQRRTERPRAGLLGLPEAEWGRFVPDGSWVLREHEPFEASPGRAWWAGLLSAPDFPGAFRRPDVLATRRGRRLVGADDMDAEAARSRWRSRWHEEGPTLEGVRDLWRAEAGRPGGPRSRAVGAALGGVVGRRSAPAERDAAVEDALGLVAEAQADRRAPLLRGAVRELRRSGPEGRLRAALLRCRASASGDPALTVELRRVVGREEDLLRALLADASGPGGLELVLAAAPGATEGDAVARELVRLGAAETGWTPERARSAVRALTERAGGAAVLADLVGTALAEGRSAVAVDALAAEAVPRLDADGLRAVVEAVGRGSDGADPEALEALAVRTLPPFGDAAGPGDDALAAAALARLADARAPAERPEPWLRIVSDAPPAWLGRPAVLEVLLDALGAGRRPFSRPRSAGEAELAGRLARRILERVGSTGLGEERADAVLRLLWAVGADDPLDALEDRPEVELGVLAELLVHPAPVPLFHRIRRRLVAALERTGRGDPARARAPGAAAGGDPATGRLALYAPAVAHRLAAPRRARRLFLVRGR